MKKADWILRNAILLTMNEKLEVFNPGSIAIKADSILAVGTDEEISSTYEGKEIFDCEKKVLMPGFVNTHTHVPMTLLRGLSDDLRLDVWLLGYMMPVEREFVTPEFVRLGTQIACLELIQSGVTSFCDMYYFEETVGETAAQIGMRAVCSQTVMKFPTPDAHSYEESLALSEQFIKNYIDHPLIIPSIAPHAPYTCPPEVLKACTDIAIKYDIPLHTHISETKEEVANMRAEQGMPVVPWVKKQGLFEAKTIAAHCVHIDEGEIRTLEHANVGVAHNPSSNLKLASGIAPVHQMLELGLNVGIGTDGTASNNDLDFFEEMRLATFLAKGSTGDPTVVPASQTLEMATRMGADAIFIGDITGSLEVGKRADLILINLEKIHNIPHFRYSPDTIYSQIVYASKATDVTDVMINGNWVMRDRNVFGVDEKELIQASQEYAGKIDKFISRREKSLISKLIAIGGASQEESFEVQAKVSVNNPKAILKKIESGDLKIIRTRHYHEYDTYFDIENNEDGWLRFREDHFVETDGRVSQVRSRITLVGPNREHKYPSDVLLSRSRFFAPAEQSLRFYREYFNPTNELEIEKDRLRYLVEFEGEEFFINLDEMIKPKLGFFLEIKSRTWSEKDAEEKTNLIEGLLNYLGVSGAERITKDYIEIVENQ